jgi:predicted membrane metal-binding protein
VGLALLVAFLVGLLMSGRDRALWRSPVALGSYAVLIAFVLHGFVDDVVTYPKAALSFFVLMGLLRDRKPDPTPRDST